MIHPLTLFDIEKAYQRTAPFIRKTPLLTSTMLNRLFGHHFFFKAEPLQKTGSFKIRGALNALLKLKEQNRLPREVITFSSGNHASAVAYASSLLGIKASIYMPQNVSTVKMHSTKSYGANVILCSTRQLAEKSAKERGNEEEAFLLPPYDHDDIIAGQGTVVLEAFQDEGGFDFVSAPCGGGGLLSGTLIATKGLSPKTQVIGGEPLLGNDAQLSLQSGTIHTLNSSPPTLADGARTLSLSERTFYYLKQITQIMAISEKDICHYTQILTHFLKLTIEPTSSLAFAGIIEYLSQKNFSHPHKILIILSGGNIDPTTYLKIWEKNHLTA